MTPSETKQLTSHPRNASETKQRILAAAKTLFAKNGYGNVGTRAIAAEANVNITLINRYFGSKKNLFAEIMTTLGKTPRSARTEKENALAAIMDFLSEDENARKEEIRLILFSALDPEVSDIIFDFFIQQYTAHSKIMPGQNKETRSYVSFSLIAGIALSSFVTYKAFRNKLDKNYIEDFFQIMMDRLYSSEAALSDDEKSATGNG